MSRCLTIGWDELFSEARKVGVIRTNHLLYQGKGSQKIIARNVSFWRMDKSFTKNSHQKSHFLWDADGGLAYSKDSLLQYKEPCFFVNLPLILSNLVIYNSLTKVIIHNITVQKALFAILAIHPHYKAKVWCLSTLTSL